MISPRFQTATRVGGILLLAVLAACGSDKPAEPVSTVPTTLPANYVATVFSTTPASGGASTNQLSRGGALTIRLLADGTTTGRLVVQPSGAGAGINESMAGTWALTGATVRFTQGADTFVRDMPFTVQATTLLGDATFQGTRIQVTLKRQ